MNTMYQKLSGALLMLAVLAASSVSALAADKAPQAADKSPQALVEQVTADLFATVKKYKATGNKTDAYFADVEKELDSVVDFPFIAKAVMRKSAKGATPEQTEKFTKVFKSGLVKTYAKGIANYADSTVKTLPVKLEEGANRVSVAQEVSDKGKTHELSYTMKLIGADWKLINVSLNGVNLGESFTSQFDQAMIKNGNDVDKVIATWLDSN